VEAEEQAAKDNDDPPPGRTGYVAAGEIINLHIPQLYSIVCGKVGKAVELGLSWGVTRLRGGFLLATMASSKADFTDTAFAVRAVEDLIALFGKGPRPLSLVLSALRGPLRGARGPESRRHSREFPDTPWL
jgi:hypothetical protein